MTINLTNQYGVGFISPPSGSTFTTCYSLSSTSTTSSTNVYSSTLATPNARSILLSQDLRGTSYNTISSSRVVQSRARCRTPLAQSSVTCLGERGIPTAAAATVGASEPVPGVILHQHNQPAQSRVELDQSTAIKKMETWPESFQDLRSWCPPDQDELNTPQITMQDEFNFSPDGLVNNCYWGFIQPPSEGNDQLLNQELLLASPNNITDEENNNYTVGDMQGNLTSYIEDDANKSLMSKGTVGYSYPVVVMSGTSALKTKSHDVLLSQAVQLDESPPVLGGGFFDIKLNSSQTSNTATKLGSGGKLIIKLDNNNVEELKVPVQQSEVVVSPALAIQEPLQQQPQTQCQPLRRPPQGKPSRPKLKPLNIPQPAPPTSNTIATPDVLKPLTDISGFNLLQYVCEGQQQTKEEYIPLQDHDYAESVVDENVLIKNEPLSPGSSSMASTIGSNRKRSYSRKDYDSDPAEIDSESDESDWLPSKRLSTPGQRGRRARKSSSTADSMDEADKYRALRDRNNEASRRSRQNRKQRDMEIRKHKVELERRNNVLRVKADRMEALVKEMREALLQSIKRSKTQPSN